jgi:hypothetical protein
MALRRVNCHGSPFLIAVAVPGLLVVQAVAWEHQVPIIVPPAQSPQSEERLPFYALLQSAAYFVKNGILLSVDLSAGLVVGAPGVFAFGFQRSHGTLPLQFLKEGDYPHS